MKTTILSVLAALVVTSQAAPAQSIYKAGTYKYKRTQGLTITATMGGQDNTSTVSTEEHLSLVLTAKGRDTLDFALTIDSVSGGADVPGAGDGGGRGGRGGGRAMRAGGILGMLGGGSALEGQSLRGAMSPNGRFHDAASAPIAAQALRQFLIVLPTTLRAGAKWTDTMPPLILPFGGPNVDGNRIAETEVVRDTTYAGQRAWKLRRTVVVDMSATTPMGGRANSGMGEIYAEGAGDGTFYVSLTGVFLGGTEILDLNISVSLGPNLQIPAVVRQENTISFVR